MPARAHAPRPRALAGERETRVGRRHTEAERRRKAVADLRVQPRARIEVVVRREAPRVPERPQLLGPARVRSDGRREGEGPVRRNPAADSSAPGAASTSVRRSLMPMLQQTTGELRLADHKRRRQRAGVAVLTAIPTNSRRISSRTALRITSAGNPYYCILTNRGSSGKYQLELGLEFVGVHKPAVPRDGRSARAPSGRSGGVKGIMIEQNRATSEAVMPNFLVTVCASCTLWLALAGATAAQVPCTDWNTKVFFENAAAADVSRCLSSGANLEARTERGLTPLHMAAKYSTIPSVIAVLLDAGANLEARTIGGSTSLHEAVLKKPPP